MSRTAVLRLALRSLLAVIVLGAGVGTAVYLVKHAPKPKRQVVEIKPTLVKVTRARLTRQRVRVVAMGTVVPARRVVLQPEVSGRVTEHDPRLVPGGRFRQGEVVVKIDARDYEFAVSQREAALEQARLQLQLEQGRQAVAEREWKLLESDIKTTKLGRELALRKPQQKNAQSALAAASSALDNAKLNVERTRIRVPFNAMVQDESVELGQLVGPQTALATLVGTDRFWVRVSVPVDRLKWLRLPDAAGAAGAEAEVEHELGPQTQVVRRGRVIRLLGDLDPVGRMARLLVAIDDPLALRPEKRSVGNPAELPLLLGAYVRVELVGRQVDGVAVVPRVALREGDRLWIMNDAGQLEERPVLVFWRRQDTVLVRDGVRDGERIVTSRIATPIPGMKLRVADDSAASRPTGEPGGDGSLAAKPGRTQP